MKSTPSVEEKLDEIVHHLKRMDSRDRLRTWGSFFRTLLWAGIIIWSSWYFVLHAGDLMKLMTEQAASTAAKYSQSQGQGMLDQFMKQYNKK